MAYNLSPISTMQFEDANGVPYAGAQLFCWVAGTQTKQTTYKTNTGTANTNPIILDAQGRPPFAIWTPAGLSYRYFLATSTDTDPPIGTAIYELDNVGSINDPSASQSEWVAGVGAPTYLSATSFSVVGDQTTNLHVGRRLKTTNTSGTIYSTIKTSSYSASITTITVINDSGTLDSGLSAVAYGLISYANSSRIAKAPLFNCSSASSDGLLYTLTSVTTTDAKPVEYTNGHSLTFVAATTNLGAVTCTLDSMTAKDVKNFDTSALRAGQLVSGYHYTITYSTSLGYYVLNSVVAPGSINAVKGGARQAVNLAPVNTSGLPTYGGSTGSTTVTTTAISSTSPFICNASNYISSGVVSDVIGYSASNLSWTGLSTNGTMYLYVDISATTGLLTTGSTTLAPVYQFGGTPSTTSGQATFNYSQMQMFVGNGTTAPQTNRVFVGEVTVAGNVTTAITWYAVNKKYQSSQVYTKNTVLTYNHNLGEKPRNIKYYLECTTIDNEYQVGDFLLMDQHAFYIVTTYGGFSTAINSLNAVITTATDGIALPRKTTAPHNVVLLTDSSWKIHVIIE